MTIKFAALKNPRVILLIELLVVVPFVTYNFLSSKDAPKVLSSENTAGAIIGPLSTEVPSPPQTPSPTPELASNPSKSSYTIAIIGDSMVDTMGENLSYLQEALRGIYPKTQFNLYNYGIGGQNVKEGLSRFDNPFSYQTRNYPPITQLEADIIIVASFAYNPFPLHNRDQHWLNLAELVKAAKTTGASIYLLCEIAPIRKGFGVGPGGINWPQDQAYSHSLNIIEQLQNCLGISGNLNVPVVDAFDASRVDGNFSSPEYVSTHDGIHPSVQGHLLMAQLIASRLKLP